MEFRVSKKDRYKSGIYRISNTIDGRIYYGSAERFAARYNAHKNNLSSKTGRRANKHLFHFVKKYGIDKLVFEIMEFCPIENLFEREQIYLDELFAKPAELRFNIARTAINIGYLNLNMPGEQGRRISAALKGRKKSESYSVNFSIAKGRPIGKFSLDGDLLERYESNMFVKRAGYNDECVRRVCVGERLSYKGHYWSFLEDKEGNEMSTIDTSTKSKVRYEKEVCRYTKNGGFIKKYRTADQATEELGYNSHTIRLACKEKRESLIVGIWLYNEEYGEKDLDEKTLSAIRRNRFPLYSGFNSEGQLICGPNLINIFYKKFKYSTRSIKKSVAKGLEYKGLYWIAE